MVKQMAKVNSSVSGGTNSPAMTPEARENQMIALAESLAEKQLREGTASSQVITHYLKLGSIKERVELEKLRKEVQLVTAKTEAYESTKRIEELYSKALDAMKDYGYTKTETVDDDYED